MLNKHSQETLNWPILFVSTFSVFPPNADPDSSKKPTFQRNATTTISMFQLTTTTQFKGGINANDEEQQDKNSSKHNGPILTQSKID